jgi:hypothetical protein
MADKCMVVLQNCNETYPTSSLAVNHAMNINVEEVSVIQGEDEDPLPVSFPAVKAEFEVSCLCVHH